MSNEKTIAIVGTTGRQGGSVATLFTTLPNWHVRGLTRTPTKPSATAWKSKAIDLITADIDTPSTLTPAFANANVIFGTTDFWSHIASPDAAAEAQTRNISINEVAYERELKQAINIIDAAAGTLETLDRFVLSTLSYARKWSKGEVTFNLHFDSKAQAVEYLKETHPALWEKTSLLHVGFYADNWKGGRFGHFGLPEKGEDGAWAMEMPMGGVSRVPLVDVVADTGNYVQALLSLPPKTTLVGCGSHISWTEYAEIWGRVNNISGPISLSSYPVSVLEQKMGTVGKELGAMFTYMDKFGYDGGDPDVIYPWQAKEKFGVEVKYTTMEEYFKKQDWKEFL